MKKTIKYTAYFLILVALAAGLYLTRDPCDCPVERELVLCPLSVEGSEELVMRVIEIKVQYHDECCPYYKGNLDVPMLDGDVIHLMETERW